MKIVEIFSRNTGLSVEEQGWTMDIELSSGALRPFRGTNTAFPNEWEGTFGNTFGSSPIVVRFQGGRSQSSSLADPCNVDENDPFGEVLPGSLTPWVSHPAELGLVTTPSGANYTPNMIRFCVLFDRTNAVRIVADGQQVVGDLLRVEGEGSDDVSVDAEEGTTPFNVG